MNTTDFGIPSRLSDKLAAVVLIRKTLKAKTLNEIMVEWNSARHAERWFNTQHCCFLRRDGSMKRKMRVYGLLRIFSNFPLFVLAG